MNPTARKLHGHAPPRLTPELVALVAREVVDTGPAPGVVVHSEDDYEASLQDLLAAGAWQGRDVLDRLRKLWRREMTVKPPNTPPRWVTVKAGQQAVRAIAFVADRHGPNFVGGLTPERIANVLCCAVGHWGSGAEYLMQTVDHLDRLGIEDSNLSRLQRHAAQQLLDIQAAGAIPTTAIER